MQDNSKRKLYRIYSVEYGSVVKKELLKEFDCECEASVYIRDLRDWCAGVDVMYEMEVCNGDEP